MIGKLSFMRTVTSHTKRGLRLAIIVGCIPAISQVFRIPGGSSNEPSRRNPYAKYYTNSGIHTGSEAGRGRVSHISSPGPVTSISEENLFDGIRSKTEIVSLTIYPPSLGYIYAVLIVSFT